MIDQGKVGGPDKPCKQRVGDREKPQGRQLTGLTVEIPIIFFREKQISLTDKL